MASSRATGVAMLLLAVLLAALTGCSAQTLRIFPLQKRQTVPIGKAVVLTCQVDAPDPGLVTLPMWRDPKGNIINEAMFGTRPEIYVEPMAAKQSQLLYITSITPAMAGKYTCIATYTNTPLKESVVLDTYVAVTWTNAHESQYAIQGREYKIMCEVTAEPPPSIGWFKDSTAIVTGDRYVIHTNGLLIKNVQESDDGTYTCRAVVIQTGELAERTIKLEVLTAPVMLDHERDVTLKAGDTGTITCQATGVPPPTYTWIKSSTRENLSTTSRYSVNNISGQLSFHRIEAGDYGKYLCVASNKAGSNDTSFQVEVLVPPKIFDFKNLTFAENTEGALECRASGRPAPRITFRKLSNKDPFVEGLNDDGRISVDVMSTQTGDQMQSTGILTISDLRRSDDGLYECLARSPVSPAGGVALQNGHLTVQFKPTFENMPQVPVWSWNAQPVNISCLAESIPNATIKWRFHDYDLVGSPHVRIYGSGPYSYITIIPSDRSLYGYYKCIATNPLGEAVHTIQLREAYPPGPVAQLNVKETTATTVEFDLVGPGEDMGPPILAFTTQFKETGNFDWTFAQNRTWSVNSPYVVEDLTPMVSYSFRFAAVNQVGVGAWGVVKTVEMPRRSTPEAPTWRENISSEDLIHSKYPDRYELRWKIPASNGEPIDMYEIEICPIINVSGEWRVTDEPCEKRDLRINDAANFEVTGLNSDSRYRMSVRAHNVLGLSPAISLLIQTAPGVDDSENDDGNHDGSGNGGARGPKLSSGAIIGLALAGVLLFLIIVDLILFCWKRIGVAASLCTRRVTTHKDDESKLGSTKPRAPPSPAPLPPPVKLFPSPTDEKEPLKDTGEDIMKRNSSVEFDGHRAFATSGGPIIGKNSAV